MKHLSVVQREAERIAKKNGLELTKCSGYSDGTYCVEFAEKKETRQIGFVSEPSGKAGKYTGQGPTPRGRR